jgi:VCBS repeat-containing protein
MWGPTMISGVDFQVPVTNPTDTRFFETSTASLPNGNVAATWVNYESVNGTTVRSIGVRVIGSDGQPITTELVDAGLPGNERFPEVVAIDDTHFAVIYCNTSGYDLQGRVYTITGSTLAAGPVVSLTDPAFPGENGYSLGVSSLPDGKIIVAYTETSQDYTSSRVMAQTFDANLNRVGTAVQISQTATASPGRVRVDSDGNKVVVAWSQNQADTKVHALATAFEVGSDGSVPATAHSDVDISVNGGVHSVTTLANGDVLVVYNGGPISGGSLDDGDRLFGKIYSPGLTGNPTPFLINETVVETGTGIAEVVAFKNGGFAVYWSQLLSGNQSTGMEIYTRIYDKNYQAVTGQVQANASNSLYDNAVEAVVDANGNVTLVWERDISGGTPSTVIVGTTLPDQDPDGKGPRLAGDNTVETNEGQAVVLTTADFTVANAIKAPADSVYTVSSLVHGTVLVNNVAVSSFTQAQLEAGVVLFQHDGGETLTGSFRITADFSTDPSVNGATITVNVAPVNDVPTAAGDFTLTVPEGGSYIVTLNDLRANDADGHAVTYSVNGIGSDIKVFVGSSQVTSFTHADVVAGRVSIIHASDANNPGTITLTASDGHGGSLPVTLNVGVIPVNDAPQATGGTVSTLEDHAYTFKVSDFAFGDSVDVPPNSLEAVVISTLPIYGSLTIDGRDVTPGETIAIADVGNLVYTPGANGHGVGYVDIGFKLRDDGGTANGGLNTSAEAFIHVNVSPLNDAPTSGNKVVNILEDASYTFSLADFAFSDAADGAGANQFVTLIIEDLPSAGTLELNDVVVTSGQVISAADVGKLVYTPAPNRSGSGFASFTFIVQDDGGKADGGNNLSATYTVTINVTPINDAPVAASKTLSVDEDTAYTFSAADFGFSDPNDAPAPNELDAIQITTISGGGSLTLHGNAVTVGQWVNTGDLSALVFTPPANALGQGYASFSYLVRDDGGTDHNGADTSLVARTITLDVVPKNDAPVISGLSASLAITDAVTTRPFGSVVVQDLDSSSLTATVTLDRADLGAFSRSTGFRASPDGTYTITGSVALVQNALRNLTYDPTDNKLAPGLVGAIKFTLKISDGQDTTTQAVDLNITSVNDTPVAIDDGVFNVNEGSQIAAGSLTGVLANDRDADRDQLTVSSVSFGVVSGTVGTALAGTYGTLVLNADGSYTYVADQATADALVAGQSGQDVFTYYIADGNGGTISASLRFQINGTTIVVEGVVITKTTVTNTDGSSTQTLKVPTITDGGSDGMVDVPVVTSGTGSALLSVLLPTGVGMEVSGSPLAKDKSSSLADLLKVVQDHTTAGSADQQTMSGGVQSFLAALPSSTNVLVQTVDISSSNPAGQPIAIRGAAAAGGPATAVIVDASGLPSGTALTVDDVDFVVVIGAMKVTGGNGSQNAWGDSAAQYMVLGADDDTIHGGAGDDYVGSYGGNDRLYGDEGNDTVSGGEGNDTLDGGSGIDLMLGGIGNDTFYVDRADDAVIEYRGRGTDTIYSSANYMLTGHVENLVLTGNALHGYGNGLANVMRATANGSLMHGWGGNDKLYGGAGVDRLYGSSGDDRLYGNSGNDRLYGGTGKDRLEGGTGLDYMLGESGNDILKGGDGHDTINGGSGNDVIYGGKGKDILYGSYGRDAFVFDTKIGKGEVDTIRNFNTKDDTIRLENGIFTKVGKAGWLTWDAFTTGSKAADAEDRIIYDAAKGALYYDKDGAGGSAQVQFAKIDKHLKLTAFDFQIV